MTERILNALRKAKARDDRLRKKEIRLFSLQADAKPATRWWWRLRWRMVNAASLEAQQEHYAIKRKARRLGLLDHRTHRS